MNTGDGKGKSQKIGAEKKGEKMKNLSSEGQKEVEVSKYWLPFLTAVVHTPLTPKDPMICSAVQYPIPEAFQA